MPNMAYYPRVPGEEKVVVWLHGEVKTPAFLCGRST